MAEEKFSSYFGVPLIVKGQIKGVLEVFGRKILKPDEEWLNFLSTLGGQAAIAVDNHNLFENLQRSNVQLTLAYDATIEGWSRALDLRDEETEGHTQRVTNMTLRLCEVLGISEAERVQIRRGSLLHDIGKMGIPDSILLKPGPLTAEEWVVMQKHPIYAYEFLSPVSFLRPALDIPYCHHEKWDGTGYPRGIRGEQIQLRRACLPWPTYGMRCHPIALPAGLEGRRYYPPHPVRSWQPFRSKSRRSIYGPVQERRIPQSNHAEHQSRCNPAALVSIRKFERSTFLDLKGVAF